MANHDLENFQKTLHQLRAFLAAPIVDDRDRAGIIQAFEFTFEQSWKAIQKIAGKAGSQVGNPKQAFSFAMQSGWIDPKEESFWLKLLEDRNLTSHTYKMDLANQVLERVQSQYLLMFETLYRALEIA